MLLTPEKQRGALSVEEQGGADVGHAARARPVRVGQRHAESGVVPLLQRIADALNKVPGRVLVEGHTDDQPLTSLRYRNNFELSRERAVSVAQDSAARRRRIPPAVEWSGVGSSQPRYRPESDPENRARNRRVEIIHVR